MLTVFGGKLTTHRKMAEQAVDKLTPFLKFPLPSRAATEPLPGGDFGSADFDVFKFALLRDYAGLPSKQVTRYARLYGIRALELLGDANRPDHLGPCFGADLHAREIEFLMDREWARTAEDIVWRRTKLGLRLTAAEIDAVDGYVRARRVKQPA